VLSSVYEGFGLVLLEAMTLGVLCIQHRLPERPAEILGNGESAQSSRRRAASTRDALLE